MKKIFRDFFVIIINLFVLVGLVACSGFYPARENKSPSIQSETRWEIKVRDTYFGTREGSLQSITLSEGFTFITIPMCLSNLADTKRAITFSDIYVVTSADEHIPPMGQAYRQSEAFGWLLPIMWVFGARSVSDEFWYTPIQSFEMLPLDASASIGCTDTEQFRTLPICSCYPLSRHWNHLPYTSSRRKSNYLRGLQSLCLAKTCELPNDWQATFMLL